MGVIYNIADYQQLLDYIESAGTFDSIQQAVNSGAVQSTGKGAFTLIQGGAGTPIIDFQSALDAAQNSGIQATLSNMATGAVNLAKESAESLKYCLVGLATLDIPMVAAMCAPLAGAAIGESLYKDNPKLWSKISATLLPFCYEENKIQAYINYYIDPVTGLKTPVMLLATAIIDALRDLFEQEDVHTQERYIFESEYGNITGAQFPTTYESSMGPDYPYYATYDYPAYGFVLHDTETGYYYCYSSENISYRNDYYGHTYQDKLKGFLNIGTSVSGYHYYSDMPIVEMAIDLARRIVSSDEGEVDPSTPGVEVPTIDPAEIPGLTPDNPIIIIIEPEKDPKEVPTTPVTPLLPPHGPTPLLPEHVPDPTPETKPEEWPKEDPWPTVIPFPVQPTEPDPDPEEWPEVMPWPLPPEKPEDWPKTPEVPEEWPEEYPENEPWPESPEEWPEEVPWPENPPEEWPEETPWPETPEEWPEEVPWPTPWPEDWPDDQPWPIPWPEEVPYPIPYPYPEPSPNPYPNPYTPEDPDRQIDPYIDPWPYPYPNPYPNPNPNPTPNPYDDPSQPSPYPVDRPYPWPDEPLNPYPTPPSGEPTTPSPPIIPLPFSSTTGLISVYHPTQSELLAFAQWLWVTWDDASIAKVWNNPFDGIITLFELYCTPTDVGRKNIRSGFLDSGVSSETISRYTEIDCGSIGVPEYFGNYFDYSPYSKCHIYLPFIGIVELNVDHIVGHGVNVTYRIDEYNGSCIAMITCAKSTEVNGSRVDYNAVNYQFSGNCAVELPIAGGSQAAIKAGLMEAAAWGIGSVIGGVLTGTSLKGIEAGLAYGAASAVRSVVSAKSSVQHSGSFGSSYGAMGAKIPYLIVTRPKQIQVPNYNELYGYQAHKMVRIEDCTGYLRCREVHVISATASDDEKAKIEELLKTGVYILE